MSNPRPPHPWLDAALEFGRLHNSFIAIDPRTNPSAWCAWRNYFRWLNWAPYWFLEVERKHDQHRDSSLSWTAPIDHPDRFTVAFQPIKGNPPVFPLTQLKPLVAFSADERREHVNRVQLPARDAEPLAVKRGWLTPAAAADILARYERDALDSSLSEDLV